MKLYSNNCPKCKIVKNILDSKQKDYNIISDMNDIIKKAEELGTNSLPILVVESDYYSGIDAIDYVKGL